MFKGGPHSKEGSGMSLKNLRQRFKPDKDEKKDLSRLLSGDSDHFEMVDPLEDPLALRDSPVMFDKSKTVVDEEEGDLEGSFKSPPGLDYEKKDKSIFEIQLNELQDQLMAVMIENQKLKSELNSSRTITELDRVKSELQYERQRCDVLEKKLDSAVKKSNKVCRSSSDVSHPRNRLSPPPSSSHSPSPSPTPSIGDEEGLPKDEKDIDVPIPGKKRFGDSIKEYIFEAFYSFMDDFSEAPPVDQDVDPDGEPLTVKTLKENIKRFGSEGKPYLTTLKGVGDLLAWKNAPYTLIVFMVYMYSVWKGWFLSFFLFCLTFRYFINFLRYRGWNIQFKFFDIVEEEKETEEKDLGVSDKFNLVLQVARKVQNTLGEVADGQEKIKSLLTWRHPSFSRQLLVALIAAFVVSCVLPAEKILFYGGLYLGVKLFIFDHIFRRFPKVKQKYDSTARIWQELPTDMEYERRYVKSEMDKYILPYGMDKGDNLSADNENLSMDDRSFCELFSLPDSECPLPGWRGGRRCTLINREKSLTAAFKNGRLYLTHSFLCFERTKSPSPKNIVIPLADISRLEKAKPYSWIPGGGMAIEIAVIGSEKPYIFGAIINRDEVFENLLSSGRKVEMAWANMAMAPAAAAGSCGAPAAATGGCQKDKAGCSSTSIE